MSGFGISSIATSQPTLNPATPLPSYFKERRAEVRQLNEALKSGDLAAAQQVYNNIVALGKQALHRDNPFLRADRALDFNAIGGALQNGDLNGARQALAALQSTFGPKDPSASAPVPPAVGNLSGTSNADSKSGLNVTA
jgi:hypothetical protein